MKKIALFAIIALAISSCKPTKEETIDYSDKIVVLQKGIDTKEIALLDAFVTHNPETIDAAYKNFGSTIDSATKQLDVIGNFDGKSYFLDAAKALFGTYKSVSDNEYSKLVALNKIADGDFTTENVKDDSINTANVNAKLDGGLAEFKKIHQQFATEYNFEIEKTKKEKEAAGE